MRPQRHCQDKLDRLKSRLVSLPGHAEVAALTAHASLTESDTAKAAEVIRGDNVIDLLEVEVEEVCIQLLALQQPMARDLRFITMAMKIANDLERVGDHA